jgi:hypothetical protein
MRTTLEIDDDVLALARERAAREGVSIGHVVSALACKALLPLPGAGQVAARNGIALLPVKASSRPVTLELVNQLRDELA